MSHFDNPFCFQLYIFQHPKKGVISILVIFCLVLIYYFLLFHSSFLSNYSETNQILEHRVYKNTPKTLTNYILHVIYGVPKGIYFKYMFLFNEFLLLLIL